ncbi:MAG: single-stranded DNA-binding protein [Cyanobacteriota bacterium]|jgi:single-strand DNA-binding protein
MINNCTFIGNVGKDPEARYFESGSCVAEFTLAIKKPAKDEPVWINCKAWGKTAQLAADYVRKGHRIAVVAHLDQESWTDRTTGEKRSKPVFIVDRLQLLTSKAEAEGRSQGQGQQEPRQRRQTAAAAAPAWNSQLDEGDDEVPF